jgi:ribonuclease HI
MCRNCWCKKGSQILGRIRQQNVFTLPGVSDSVELVADGNSWNGRKYECSVCQKEFKNLNQLNTHLSSGVHSDAQFECKCCDKKFKRMNGLMMHLNTNSRCKTANGGRLAGVMMGDLDAMAKGTLMITSGNESRVEAELYFDGSAKPNPGYGGFGFIIYDNNGNELHHISSMMTGDDRPSNQAEYSGLLVGLEYAYDTLDIRTLRVKGDSELVIKQMKGEYGIHDNSLRRLYNRCKDYERRFLKVHYEHIPRDQNRVADRLASKGADEARSSYLCY